MAHMEFDDPEMYTSNTTDFESGENISRARMFARETAKWLPAILVQVVGTAAGLPQGLGLLWFAIGLTDLMWSRRTARGRLSVWWSVETDVVWVAGEVVRHGSTG